MTSSLVPVNQHLDYMHSLRLLKLFLLVVLCFHVFLRYVASLTSDWRLKALLEAFTEAILFAFWLFVNVLALSINHSSPFILLFYFPISGTTVLVSKVLFIIIRNYKQTVQHTSAVAFTPSKMTKGVLLTSICALIDMGDMQTQILIASTCIDFYFFILKMSRCVFYASVFMNFCIFMCMRVHACTETIF